MTQLTEEHLPAYRIRPRFEIETPLSVEELTAKIEAGLEMEGAPCKGRIHPGYATLYLPLEEQHYWSPQLSLTMESTPTGSLLRGLYGPRPAVWTMFVFFYALLGFAAVVVSVIGFSQLSLDHSGAILWLVPVFILAFLTLYLVAYFGQKLGHDQMVILHEFMEECVGMEI